MKAFEIKYNRLELFAPDRFQDLLSDLSARTNKNIEKVRIKKIDLIKGEAELEVSFRTGNPETRT